MGLILSQVLLICMCFFSRDNKITEFVMQVPMSDFGDTRHKQSHSFLALFQPSVASTLSERIFVYYAFSDLLTNMYCACVDRELCYFFFRLHACRTMVQRNIKIEGALGQATTGVVWATSYPLAGTYPLAPHLRG